MIRIAMLLICLTLCVGLPPVYAAQSTEDVPVTDEKKETLLKEILGADIGKMQREEKYVIGHGDILSIGIYEEGDMSVAPVPKQTGGSSGGVLGTQVMMDGRISLKEIGDVEVVGLTLTELADYLKRLYSVIYENPVVTTTLVQSNSLRYTVTGEVAKPGIFKLEHPINLMQVIAQSGGFSEWAKKEITVVRKELREEDKKQFDGNTLKFDYDDFVSGKELDRNIFVRSGDIVVVH